LHAGEHGGGDVFKHGGDYSAARERNDHASCMGIREMVGGWSDVAPTA